MGEIGEECMKLEIKARKRNQLMGRVEATLSVEHHGRATPSRTELLGEVAGLLKAGKDCIIIDRIITSGGSGMSEAKVLAYSKRGDIPKWRLQKMEQRIAKTKKGIEVPKESEKAPEPKEGQDADGPQEGGEAPQDAAKEQPAEPAGQDGEGAKEAQA